MDTTILAPEMKFAQESLPRSLRHQTNGDALYDAVLLAEFLQSAIVRCMESKDTMGDNEMMGMGKCFDLLMDKIEIGAGLYDFPQIGCRPSPKLCNRKEA